METVYVFVVLFSSSVMIFVAAESCNNPCNWSPWSSWSDCSRQCGGGIHRRSRPYCCRRDLADNIVACMNHCGKNYFVERSGSRDSMGCNEHCDNGGTFVLSGYCRCPDRFSGTCCKDVVTCGRPSAVSHGRFTGNDFTHAGKVHYTCDKSYNMTDPSHSTRTCTKYRYWTGSAPTCMYATSCNSSPCQNGASCVNLLGDYRCGCTSGWTGKNCEVDIQPPIVQRCPADRNIVTSNLTSRHTWSEPKIIDPHGTEVRFTKNYQNSSFVFPWGEFTIQYSAVKVSNGLKAECKFNVTVKPFPCKDMNPPINGIILCNGWRREYSRVCIFACKQGYTLPPGYKPDDIYVCGASGHWLPTNPVPQCISEKLFPMNQVKKFTTCTQPNDKTDLADFYIDFLKKSAMNALCEKHIDDCKPTNVDIDC